MGFFDLFFGESEAERTAREQKEMLKKQRAQEQAEREELQRNVDTFVVDIAKKNHVKLGSQYSSEKDIAPLGWAFAISPRKTEFSKALADFSENQKKLRPAQLNRKIKDITNLFLSSPRDQYQNYTRVLNEYQVGYDRYTTVRDQWFEAGEAFQSEIDLLDKSIEGNRQSLLRLSGGADRVYGIIDSKNPLEEVQRNQDILIKDFSIAYPNEQERIEKFIKLLKKNPNRAIEYLKDSFTKPTENLRREQKRWIDTRDEYERKLEVVSDRLEKYNHLIGHTAKKLEIEFNLLGMSLGDYERNFQNFLESLPEEQKEKIDKEEILRQFKVNCDKLRVSMSRKVKKSGIKYPDGTPVVFKIEKAPTRLTQTSIDINDKQPESKQPEPEQTKVEQPKTEPKVEQPKTEPKVEQPKTEPEPEEKKAESIKSSALKQELKDIISHGGVPAPFVEPPQEETILPITLEPEQLPQPPEKEPEIETISEEPKPKPEPEQEEKESDIEKGDVTGGLLEKMKKTFSVGNIGGETLNQPSQGVPSKNRPMTVPVTQQERFDSKNTDEKKTEKKPFYPGFTFTKSLPNISIEQPKKEEQTEVIDQQVGFEKNTTSQEDLLKLVDFFNKNQEAIEFIVNKLFPIIQSYQQHNQSQQQDSSFVKMLEEKNRRKSQREVHQIQ